MLSKLGLRAGTIASLITRLSSGNSGRENIGEQIDAFATGAHVSFVNETLAINPQAVAGTSVQQRLLTDTIGSIASPTEYLVRGNGLPWRVVAGDATTGGVSATSGIVPYSSAYPLVRGSFLFQHADVDGATSIVLDQQNLGWLPGRLSSSTAAWKVLFEVADWTNRQALRTVALAELGIAFGTVSNDPAAAFSASNHACFELSQGQVRFKGTSYTGEWVQAPSTKDFSLEIGFECATGIVTGWLNGQRIGQFSLSSAVAAQIAVRSLHRTAYTAATAGHDPIGLRLDTILASVPAIED